MTRWDRLPLIKLNAILANLYPTVSDARRIAAAAELNLALIEFDNKAINNWFNILEYANRGDGDKVDRIVDRALEEYPDDEALKQAKTRAPPPTLEGPKPSWSGPSGAPALERLMGDKSTLVPITYLEVGLLRSKSVVRVKLADGSLGTGFVIGDNILLTNNHVLPDAAAASGSIIQFNYQQTASGLSAPIEEVKLLPNVLFRTSVADDWTVVKLEGDCVAKWGALQLKKLQIAVGDHVNIIQHPGGGPKQISLFANVVVFVGGGRVQYLTDTLPGSSGSPVFDADWNVIALHHSGGWINEPNAASKNAFYRNEGISIDRILDGLAA